MTAPTEAELRATVRRAWIEASTSLSSPAGAFADCFVELSNILVLGLYDVRGMSDSEMGRLDELAADALGPVASEARQRASEALVKAGLQFAQEFPDAPRALREPVTA